MKLGPIRRAWIVLTVAALASAAAPAAASAQSGEPRITRQPSLTGSAYVGYRLSAGGATWSGRPTITVYWAWLRCGSDSLWSCEVIDGANASSYTITTADRGKRLRAVIVLTNRDGRAYGWTNATSAVTNAPPPPTPTPVPTPVAPPVPTPVPLPSPPVVTAPPAPVIPEPPVAPTPQAVAPPKMMRPAPLVRVRGYLTVRGARLTLLTVRAPKGARISVSCKGIGCPRVAPAKAAKLTRLRNYEGMFRAGTRIVVRVTRRGFVGKHTLIRIRRGKPPLRFDSCLYPGVKGPTPCQTG
jgi:hypothetical protein